MLILEDGHRCILIEQVEEFKEGSFLIIVVRSDGGRHERVCLSHDLEVRFGTFTAFQCLRCVFQALQNSQRLFVLGLVLHAIYPLHLGA